MTLLRGAVAACLATAWMMSLDITISAQSVQKPIRIWGHGALGKDYIESLVVKWEIGFKKIHPEAQFENELQGTASAIGALYTNTGDIAIMGREIWPVEVEAFTDVRGYAPLGVDIVTGSLDIRNKDFALVMFVNKQNPLSQMSMEQIRRVFSAEQPPPNTWGQLGLKGEWAKRPVHMYGFEIHRGFGYYLEQTVFHGSTKWNPELIELGDVKRAGFPLLDAGQRIVDAVGKDPDAIGYSSMLYKNADVKPLAIGPTGGPFLLATHATLANHTYPLTRSIRAFIDQGPGHPANPLVVEFLRYALSFEGQKAVIEDGGYTPLPPKVAAGEASKLGR